ncbi:hypothetical protein [Candidatus Formimonas warabiya]|uniref:Uncharacterized protein n=1 Tax=Formimonas warabiya TaxID=1761012 RepID=A0A3G1KNK7_FORW1|nr:hypothetical protein [Candidatus Formimonas warabiya]ATW24071.1 hypothetical protein DCMF_04065 [Candidatus Formimonas warabiya]
MIGMAYFVIAFLISYLITPKALMMLKSGGLMKNNFQGALIPSTAGIIFSAVLALTYVLLSFTSTVSIVAYSYLGFIAFVSLAGLVDDVAGSRDNRGFKGHFSFLFKQKEITTGVWKAAMGGIIAILAALLISTTWWDMVLNVLLIALMSNIFNLLDVRPGRSIKVFLLCASLVVIFLPSDTTTILLYPLAGAVSAYLVYDLHAKSMMGDTGSNVLGLALGLALASGGNLGARISVVAGLVLLHIVSEYCSFTRIIDHNKILGLLDRLGRRD